MARVLVCPSLNSLEAVEGTCDQERLGLDSLDVQADLTFASCTRLIVGFVARWLMYLQLSSDEQILAFQLGDKINNNLILPVVCLEPVIT